MTCFGTTWKKWLFFFFNNSPDRIKIGIDWFEGKIGVFRRQNTNKLKLHMASVIHNLAALREWFNTATNVYMALLLHYLHITILHKSITIKNKAKQ